ncbi:MAG: GTPase HflX [Candidatus Lambdaproteobacteria bacterium RIFOXYD2_FULL_50_16]|uniref:GTPase HflX n=1 Tax=Candidatus Lambdaproteobacteria bacterium RIFOXYD2_FULL_50_16 TaxID=1817772 RepID=A0A1F6G9E9_9PROT|nr:MAG: GTPase HflX [Candidatus Lambdaproteobacteria bacterium RIFOXYD2_FULL_50_16]
MIENQEAPKQVFLAAVHLKQQDLVECQRSMVELAALADTLGFVVVGQEIQSRDRPDGKGYLGKGKLAEIKERYEVEPFDILILDHDLSPNQGRFLEQYFGTMVIDRTQLILEIFADHAQTPEARAQVELAQLKYMLPRLVGMWAHLDREKGGISASRGTGEKQVTTDRNIIRLRISRLEKQLAQVEKDRGVQSKNRQNCLRVALVGYTNAGKTTLMNRLSDLGIEGKDQLFATLESRTRKMDGFFNPEILLSDTVGFIQNLPHSLVASFRSTLAVVRDADLLLHIADAHSPKLQTELRTTFEVLEEIGAHEVPQILVLSKADLVSEPEELVVLRSNHPQAVVLSAFDPEGLARLKASIEEHFANNFVSQEVLIPYNRTSLVNRFHQLAQIEVEEYQETGVWLKYRTTLTNGQILDALLEKKT